MAQKLKHMYPKQTIDTKTHRWQDVIGWCPECKIETVISGYSITNKLIQECCRTCGSWWDIHEQILISDYQRGKVE